MSSISEKLEFANITEGILNVIQDDIREKLRIFLRSSI